jgi:hypothetical protein
MVQRKTVWTRDANRSRLQPLRQIACATSGDKKRGAGHEVRRLSVKIVAGLLTGAVHPVREQDQPG